MRKTSVSKTPPGIREDVRQEYDFDYRKAKPNRFARQVEGEWLHIKDGSDNWTQAEWQRVAQHFTKPAYKSLPALSNEQVINTASDADKVVQISFARWLERNVKPHQVPGYASVLLSLKPHGSVAPGDATTAQMRAIADLADQYSFGELRTTHEQNIVLADVRKQIAFVSQDVVLFNDTIAANVAYGADSQEAIDRGRVMEALEAANLSSLIKELPEGIDSIVGDNGNRLSGGQRQRMAIARAIYKNAPILILDEATSALDSESERQVQDALERLMAGRTTLVIAHRLSTIEHADRIVVLEHGQIIENGSHEDLIKQDGVYANLHRIQFSNA